MGLQFQDDIAFSADNGVAYRELFVLEQWLRRVAHAALMAHVGPQILGGLPEGLVRELKARVSALPSRMHLGAETAEEPLWMTTLEELRDLLVSDGLFPTVRELTGYYRGTLGGKLNEIREIRNVIGHNRAVTPKTIAILEADLMSLEDGIGTFKRAMLLDGNLSVRPVQRGEGGRSLGAYFARRVQRRTLPVPREALILTESKYFYFAVIVPRYALHVDTAGYADIGLWVHGQTALEHLALIGKTLLAIVLPRRGGCFTLVWPKKCTDAEHRRVVDTFLDALEAIWSDEDYVDQDPRFICNPKFWFAGTRATQ